MLFWAIGVLAVILGFSVAIYVVFEKFGSKVTAPSIFITAATGIIFSVVTGLVMIMSIWPPVTVASWLFFAAFAGGVSLLVLTGNKGKEEAGQNFKAHAHGTDLRSGTGN